MTTPIEDTWAAGDAYDAYVGRWSGAVAAEFVDWLDAGPALRWIDVGCGTGALARTILERADPAGIVAVDPSPGFLAHARARIRDPRVAFVPGTADALPVDDGAADAAVAALVLNFVPSPAAALAAMRRAVGARGTVAAYVWDYAAGMRMIRCFWNAAVSLDPAAAALDEARRFPLCAPDALAQAFRSAGAGEPQLRPIVVPTPFDGFDDFWTPFLGGQGPAPTYCASLTDAHRAALRDAVRERLPVEADGRIVLSARAWAAKAPAAP